MSATVSLTGNDTTVINNRVFSGLADGNVIELTYSSDISQVKTGKNGNSIFALNESGKQAEMKIKLVRGCADDKFLLNLLSQQQANFAGFPLMIGNFIKRVGDGLGNLTSDTYIASGGVFTKIPEVKTNTDGETEQSTVMYTIKFSNCIRVLT